MEWGGGGEGDLAMKERHRVASRTVNNNSIPSPGPSHYSELDSYENLIGWRDCHGGIGFGGPLQCHPLRVFSLWGPVTGPSSPCVLSSGACYWIILSVLFLFGGLLLSLFGGLLQYHPLRVFSLWGPVTVPSSPHFLSSGAYYSTILSVFSLFGACYRAILSAFSIFEGLVQ